MMKRNGTILLFLLCFVGTLSAQVYTLDGKKIAPYKGGDVVQIGKQGVHVTNGNTTSMYSFEGKRIKHDKHYTSLVGNLLISPREKYIENENGDKTNSYFSNISHNKQCNVYLISTSQGHGILDSLGNVLIAPSYDNIRYLKDSLFAVEHAYSKPSSWGIVNLALDSNRLIVPHLYTNRRGASDITINGDYIRVQTGGLKGAVYHKTGTEIIDNKGWVRNLDGEHWAVCKAETYSQWGVIDKHGTLIIPNIYHRIEPISAGLFAVCIDKKWGVVNALHQIICPIQYDNNEDEARLFATTKSSHYYKTHLKASLKDSTLYTDIKIFEGGLSIVQKGEKYGINSIDGSAMTDIVYDSIKYYDKETNSRQSRSILVGMKDKKVQIFDLTGKTNGKLYSKIDPETDNYIIVADGDNYGVIATDGSELVPTRHTLIADKGRNLIKIHGKDKEISFSYFVKKENRFTNTENYIGGCIIDCTGQQLEIGGDYITARLGNLETSGLTFIAAKKKDAYHIIDSDGKHIATLAYEQMQEYRNGRFIIKRKGKWGVVDTRGKTIVPFKYDSIEFIGKGDHYILAKRYNSNKKPIYYM